MNCPLTPSLLVHFRQRISANLINKVNEKMVKKMRETTSVKTEKKRIRTQKMSYPIKENWEHPDFASIQKYDKMRCFWEKPTLSFLQKYVLESISHFRGTEE